VYKRRNRYTEVETLPPPDVYDVDLWHLIRTQGNKVFETAAILEGSGLVAWAPLQSSWKKAGGGGSRFRIRQKSVNRPAFFNYLFVGLPGGNFDWSKIFNTGYVRAVVAITTPTGPKAYCAPKHTVNAAMARQRKGKFSASRTAKKALPYSPGDKVRVEDGHSWVGHKLRVVRIEDSSARVIGELLGKTVEFEIALDALSKSTY
jgi:transcription antitermination factor NusG